MRISHDLATLGYLIIALICIFMTAIVIVLL